MITEQSRDELVSAGSKLRADYLSEQAGYTLGVAALDGKALEELLPPGYLDEMRGVLASVNAARQDRALMAAESREATKDQAAALRAAKVWRRKIAKRASRAARLGRSMPRELTAVSQARTGPELASQVLEMTRLFEANLAAMPGSGADKLLEEGRGLCDSLASLDATQEVKRLRELPQAVQDFYEKKGLLYVGLKVIHDAGQELHADSAPQSSRYNLSILHRRGNHASQPEAAPPAPVPAS